ncbi:ATP synthase regulation protein NCA2-domain-containing protein [Pyronema domesticum]|uniref:Similar to Nuclear control of ATPase protein 2 acc. no. O74963 n=1 Tax=Pyronema omphalodes (strain CBS 100304) TaxID=1076935 RepID=U4L034_PYROM|nr:ATP synthase regulation protein NCA2-domain-containing protein [Pyronema domesticum]CCX08314.1 Similar to Nuclear control of ATPase protein 2; acc. no. O74963 [Pyronema omphalodes CBS 100304]
MTFVSDQLRHLDAQLDKLQLTTLERVPITEPGSPTPSERTLTAENTQQRSQRTFIPSPHAAVLQKIIRQLSSTDTSQSSKRLVALLQEANIHANHDVSLASEQGEHRHYERELEWLLLSKAAIQTYGIVLNSLVDQTLPLSQDLFYWDEVASSYPYILYYWLQTSPLRLVEFSKDVLAESQKRLQELREMERPGFLRPGSSHGSPAERISNSNSTDTSESLSATAQKFYSLVKSTINDRISLHRFTAMSPFSLARHEIREKQLRIKQLREMQASALGVLIGKGLSFDLSDDDEEEWRSVIERAILLMENVVRNVAAVDQSIETFEKNVFVFESLTNEDEGEAGLGLRINTDALDPRTTALLSSRLQAILTHHLPLQGVASKTLTHTHGKPSKLLRYWIPATALLLSSTTILRILVNRKADIKLWLQDLGATMVDFWANWVIAPLRSVIGTIRHSSDSEVALMSRKSLTADMESLERMVVDFTIDNPHHAGNGDAVMTAQEIEMVRANVKEGDLTPVLRAYEHDLRHPFRGAVNGELVRALLIQIQKTKVDVEVAIAGIDRLLKSQELVFGFVGLTPGLFISVVTARWVAGLFRGRQRRAGREKEAIVRRLRNVDRILTGSKAMRGDNEGCLNFKEHGLLMCEVHVLREDARRVFNRALWGEFVADLEELVDVRGGVQKQMKIGERIRWAYSRWLK